MFSDFATLISAGRAFQEFTTLLEKKFNLGSVLEGLRIMLNPFFQGILYKLEIILGSDMRIFFILIQQFNERVLMII